MEPLKNRRSLPQFCQCRRCERTFNSVLRNRGGHRCGVQSFGWLLGRRSSAAATRHELRVGYFTKYDRFRQLDERLPFDASAQQLRSFLHVPTDRQRGRYDQPQISPRYRYLSLPASRRRQRWIRNCAGRRWRRLYCRWAPSLLSTHGAHGLCPGAKQPLQSLRAVTKSQ